MPLAQDVRDRLALPAGRDVPKPIGASGAITRASWSRIWVTEVWRIT